MPKGTSCAEVMSNSEKTKSVTLKTVMLHWSEGISQSVNQLFKRLVSQSAENSVKFLNSVATC